METLKVVELTKQEVLTVEGGILPIGRLPIRPIMKKLKEWGHEAGDFFRGLYDGFRD